MSTNEELAAREETKKSLERMQGFDVSELPRESELGNLNFKDAVEPAERIVNLYTRLTVKALDDIPQQQLAAIKKQSDNDFNILKQILDFDVESQQNPGQQRTELINQVEKAYQPTFNTLHPFISYSLHRSADFQRLDTEARATFQQIRDESSDITEELEKTKDEAQNILEEVRELAAEQGVTQQAKYFKEASEKHFSQADGWKKATIWIAIGLGVYALSTTFIHKIPVIKPENLYETIQLAVSKVLVFAVISYMLYLSARNFLSHKHNGIINHHRQNALLTFTALSDAASETQNKEVILTHASACIFSPQATGYSPDSGGQSPSAKSVVELLSRPLSEGE